MQTCDLLAIAKLLVMFLSYCFVLSLVLEVVPFAALLAVLDQEDTPTNYLNVVVIYTRNHLFQDACLDIVNILLWYS